MAKQPLKQKPKLLPGDKQVRDSLQKHLSKIQEVDAVFVAAADKVVHVYSVVREHGRFYQKLMKQEQLIEKEWPNVTFDFHVRAHQGREPFLAVPHGSQIIYTR